jgi:hypothetical protein
MGAFKAAINAALILGASRCVCYSQPDPCKDQPRKPEADMTSTKYDKLPEAMARASPWTEPNLKYLRAQIATLPPDFAKDLLEMIDKPTFHVVEDRKGKDEEKAKILRELKEQGLVCKDVEGIFPSHEPMSFVAAPGSIWRQHHTYPGGLLLHTRTNLESALDLVGNHLQYAGGIDRQTLIASVIWHDSAKTMTIGWNEDGTASRSEGPTIASTGAHHIWAIAEAVYRGYKSRFIVALASAHSPAHGVNGGKELDVLIGYLRAAAVLAGKEPHDAGLRKEGPIYRLEEPAFVEGFLNHLSDHDYVLSEVALEAVTDVARDVLRRNQSWCPGESKDLKMDRVFAYFGEGLYAVLLNSGPPGVEKSITDLYREKPEAICGR